MTEFHSPAFCGTTTSMTMLTRQTVPEQLTPSQEPAGMRPTNTDLHDHIWHTAVHEAGHAVVGRKLGIPCGHVSIEVDEDSSGHSITGDVWDVISAWEARGKFRDVRSAYVGRILTMMAGTEAVLEIVGAIDELGDDDDLQQVVFMLDDVGNLSYKRLRTACRALVRRHRRSIEEVAAALLTHQTLPPEGVDELLQLNGEA